MVFTHIPRRPFRRMMDASCTAATGTKASPQPEIRMQSRPAALRTPGDEAVR